MKNPTVVAALASAVISAIVSAGIAYWTARLEINKTVLQVQQSALLELIQARLKAYPKAYQLVSQLEKDACSKGSDKGPVGREYLNTLRARFDEWDSSYAFLLGPDSTNTVYRFRQELLMTISEIGSGGVGCQDLEELLYHAGQVELALRSDLGIYGVRLQEARELETSSVERY